MIAMNLTVAQRTALRLLAGDKHMTGKPHGRTLASLKRKRLVDEDGNLTTLGERMHRSILNSGDGPEYLKSLFRF